MFQIRPLLATDITGILRIQTACYAPEMNESAAIMRARQACAPEYCWGAGERELAAYLLTYPSRLGKITPLGGDFAPAAQPDCLYLHDLAVAPQAAGNGLGAALVKHALNSARQQGLRAAALVCVQEALGFWQRCGFVEQPELDPRQAEHLATYPAPARYMQCRLDSGRASAY